MTSTVSQSFRSLCVHKGFWAVLRSLFSCRCDLRSAFSCRYDKWGITSFALTQENRKSREVESSFLAFSAMNGRSHDNSSYWPWHVLAPPRGVLLSHSTTVSSSTQQQSERRHLCTTHSKDTIQAPVQRCRRFYQNCSFQKGRNRQSSYRPAQAKSLTHRILQRWDASQRRGQQL